MLDATDQGIISEKVANLWDIHTDTLIKALELRGYRVVSGELFDTLIKKNDELAAQLHDGAVS